jgi:hypothetical protein
VRITLPSRRAAGLLAVSTIGISTAVLGVADVASAADPGSYAVDGDNADAEHPQTVAFDVEPGTCAIDWQVTGGAGSDGYQSTLAGEVDVVTQVTPGQHFVLTAGASAALNSDEAGEASTVGRAASAGGSVTTFLSAAAGPVAGGTHDANVTQQGIGDDPVDDDAIDGALGWVNARLIDCPQEPYEPDLNAGDGEATLSFGDDSDPEYTDYDAVTGYQYKVDSGAWTTVSAAPVDGEYDLHLPDDQRRGTQRLGPLPERRRPQRRGRRRHRDPLPPGGRPLRPGGHPRHGLDEGVLVRAHRAGHVPAR